MIFQELFSPNPTITERIEIGDREYLKIGIVHSLNLKSGEVINLNRLRNIESNLT